MYGGGGGGALLAAAATDGELLVLLLQVVSFLGFLLAAPFDVSGSSELSFRPSVASCFCFS